MDYKKDSHVFGGLIGLFVPIVVYLILISVSFLLKSIFSTDISDYHDEMRLLGIAANLIFMRYYFVKLKFELTGRAILLVTFIYVIVYFGIH